MNKLLHGWYRLTIPPLEGATPLERECLRYGRLISGFSLMFLLIITVTFPITVASGDVRILISTSTTAGLEVLGLLLN